jgi:hypothetical protein
MTSAAPSLFRIHDQTCDIFNHKTGKCAKLNHLAGTTYAFRVICAWIEYRFSGWNSVPGKEGIQIIWISYKRTAFLFGVNCAFELTKNNFIGKILMQY